ncbi:MAG: response regulator [Acidobacteria bacterium]|nr:response regulator [Acidobacteriota bacterium]
MNESRKKATILVVDDDPDFLLQERVQLEAAGFEVIAAPGRQEAETILETMRPDMAMIDLMMEDVDAGFTLCHHIKARYPDVPVIMVTAVTAETGLEFEAVTPDERRWIKADAILSKPVRFEQLDREVRRLLPH